MNDNPFFTNDIKEDKSSYPLYHEYTIPEKFSDVTWREIRKMSTEEFHVFMEEIRLWILDMFYNHKINVLTAAKSIDEIKSRFKKFTNQDVNKYFKEDKIKVLYGSSNKWSSCVNNWFPEMMAVKTSHSYPASVVDLLENKEYFHNSVLKVVFEDALKIYYKVPDRSFFRMFRKSLQITRGVQTVTNFPAHVAKLLHIKYLSQWDDDVLNVYDPCMGWAGRMISLFAASTHIALHNKKINLIGTDVNTDVHERFDMIYRFWDTYVSSLKNITLNKFVVPAEDMHTVPEFKKLEGQGHLAFTSPPYFDKELYSEDETQSYIRYNKNYDEWRDGFLYGLLTDTYSYLRPGGTFLLNVANTRPKKDGTFTAPIENDSIALGESVGFRYDGKYHFLISLMPGKSYKSNRNIVKVDDIEWKYEPIHILTKV